MNPIFFVQNPIFFEEWKFITDISVPGIRKNAYKISNLGRVYSLLSNSYLTPVITWNGYFRVFLRLESGCGRYFLIHRILYIEFNFVNNYNELQVNHKDGDKFHNSIENFEWNTPSENIIHAYRNGLKVKEKGEDCSYATISNDQAEQIAKLISEQKYSHQDIADIVGCPKHIVGNIATGTTWTWIYNKYNLSKYKRGFNLSLSDEDLHKLCKYFEDYSDKFIIRSDLFRKALKDLFDIEFSQNMSVLYPEYLIIKQEII